MSRWTEKKKTHRSTSKTEQQIHEGRILNLMESLKGHQWIIDQILIALILKAVKGRCGNRMRGGLRTWPQRAKQVNTWTQKHVHHLLQWKQDGNCFIIGANPHQSHLYVDYVIRLILSAFLLLVKKSSICFHGQYLSHPSSHLFLQNHLIPAHHTSYHLMSRCGEHLNQVSLFDGACMSRAYSSRTEQHTVLAQSSRRGLD